MLYLLARHGRVNLDVRVSGPPATVKVRAGAIGEHTPTTVPCT